MLDSQPTEEIDRTLDERSRACLAGEQLAEQSLPLAPVVLAGGSGTRLWPMSRANSPKQLLDIVGPDSLLQTTVRRMTGFPAERKVVATPIIMCGEEHGFVAVEQLHANGVDARLVVEPARRDTAPALTLAAAVASSHGEDVILVAMPADHAISDVGAFQRAILAAGVSRGKRRNRHPRCSADASRHRLRLHQDRRRAAGRRAPHRMFRREAGSGTGGAIHRDRQLLVEQRPFSWCAHRSGSKP